MQKRKMSHTDVIRNENGITMTLDRWMDANAQVDYICGHILVLPIVYRHHWTKSTKDRNDENSISNNIWWSQKLQHIIILQDSGDLNI